MTESWIASLQHLEAEIARLRAECDAHRQRASRLDERRHELDALLTEQDAETAQLRAWLEAIEDRWEHVAVLDGDDVNVSAIDRLLREYEKYATRRALALGRQEHTVDEPCDCRSPEEHEGHLEGILLAAEAEVKDLRAENARLRAMVECPTDVYLDNFEQAFEKDEPPNWEWVFTVLSRFNLVAEAARALLAIEVLAPDIPMLLDAEDYTGLNDLGMRLKSAKDRVRKALDVLDQQEATDA